MDNENIVPARRQNVIKNIVHVLQMVLNAQNNVNVKIV